MKYKFIDSYNEKYNIHVDTPSDAPPLLRVNRMSKDEMSWNEIYFHTVFNKEIDWTKNVALDPEAVYPDVRKYCERIIKLYHFS